MKVARSIFFSWLPLAGASTGILLVAYAGIQQNYRQSLNDPQIQMAEDAAFELSAGVPATTIVPIPQLDVSNTTGRLTPLLDKSLVPWIAIYDEAGKPITTSAILDDAMPQPPLGVFQDTKNGLPLIVGHHLTTGYPPNENRVTWQPEPGVRQALIVVWIPETKQFVVAGRNMREVEERIGKLGEMFFLGWLVLMAATLFAKILEKYFA